MSISGGSTVANEVLFSSDEVFARISNVIGAKINQKTPMNDVNNF